MTIHHRIAIAALLVGLPIGAAAQDTQPDPAQPPEPTTGSSASQSALTTKAASDDSPTHWVASGFLGSNFANNADPASLSVGGSIGYLWKNRFGVEADLGFSPSFQLQNNFFGLGVKPTVNTYMANAIGAIPLGREGRVQPFVSGGIGAISLRSGVDGAAAAAALGIDPSLYSSSSNETRFGGNIGGGVVGF